MTCCHHYHNSKSQAYSSMPQCDGLPFIQSNKQNGYRSVKWFTPYVDLFSTHLNHKVPLYVSPVPDQHAWVFSTHLNHKVPLYVSPVPDQHAWDIDAQNIIWLGLTSYAYPPTAPLHRVIQKIRQLNCLISVRAPGWPVMPWVWNVLQLLTEIPLQLPVSRTLL